METGAGPPQCQTAGLERRPRRAAAGTTRNWDQSKQAGLDSGHGQVAAGSGNIVGVYALMVFGLATGVVLFLVLAARNSNMLFAATIRNGRIAQVRGRAPKALLRDIGDVVGWRPVVKAEIRVVVRDRMPFVEASKGLESQELQRVRNVVGRWELAKIRATPYRSK